MSKRKGSGSMVFLMEMMMVVFFFIICASICISVFVKADQISKRAYDLNQAVLTAQSIAETVKVQGAEAGLRTLGGTWEEGAYGLCFYTSDWESRQEGADAAYRAEISFAESEGFMQTGDIAIRECRTDELLFSLTSKTYQKE